MSTLLLTVIIAFTLVIIAIGLLAVSWLITGKSSIRAGACGRAPERKRNEKEGCGTSSTCSLCEKPKESNKKSNDVQ